MIEGARYCALDKCYVVPVAQVVRAPDCGSGGRGFKSLQVPQDFIKKFRFETQRHRGTEKRTDNFSSLHLCFSSPSSLRLCVSVPLCLVFVLFFFFPFLIPF